MKKQLSPNNPFGYTDAGYLWEVINERPPGRHLDYGAHDGRVLKGLAKTARITEGVGLDMNATAVASRQYELPDSVKLVSIAKNESLPFPDASFDSVSMLGVIEHIADQKRILKELARVLKPNGVFVASVPKKHVFSFLDMGNFKFVFPRIHRFFYTSKFSEDDYHKRYVECANGLFGDIEVDKMWHEHFSVGELEALLGQADFRLAEIDGTGLFTRPLTMIQYFAPRFLRRSLSRLMKKDAKRFESNDLVVTARPAGF